MSSIPIHENAASGVSSGVLKALTESLSVICDTGSIDVKIHGVVRDSITAPDGITYDVEAGDDYEVITTAAGTSAWATQRLRP